ncbi:MAG: 3-methyl-2-oxobutanoate hydroxymethyltransferase [Elusimicrobiota bacterium]|jgi:3-methyl-2-oxobutanoate hydroxymethyltransferase|nr:3-methyl-2-oxobutanoate hydroxymethyltransferase [Elusimicrobiota bacterium]
MSKTVNQILQKKAEGKKISMLTCYDYSMAKVLSKTDLDIILVGDSLANVKLGMENTLPVTVENMIYHTQAVKRANPPSLLVCDMPFMSYEVGVKEALRNAGRIIKESGAQAVKVEGGSEIIEQVKALVKANIPVMGHLGLTPQAVNRFGGFKVQAKDKSAKEKIIEDAKMLQDAGAFSVVLEAIPELAAKEISQALSIVTIGIGAGKFCDGQVLVIDDMLGMFDDFKPKFVKRYANLSTIIEKAVNDYIDEVGAGKFPSEENTYK